MKNIFNWHQQPDPENIKTSIGNRSQIKLYKISIVAVHSAYLLKLHISHWYLAHVLHINYWDIRCTAHQILIQKV